jgi:hypothetical protein
MDSLAKRLWLCLVAIAIAAAGVAAALLGLNAEIAFDPPLHSPYGWKSKAIGAVCLASVLVALLAAGKTLQRSKSLER